MILLGCLTPLGFWIYGIIWEEIDRGFSNHRSNQHVQVAQSGIFREFAQVAYICENCQKNVSWRFDWDLTVQNWTNWSKSDWVVFRTRESPWKMLNKGFRIIPRSSKNFVKIFGHVSGKQEDGQQPTNSDSAQQSRGFFQVCQGLKKINALYRFQGWLDTLRVPVGHKNLWSRMFFG